ncbi:MAG: phosphotransferase family protein [Candidatus Eremiobacteraeota bacterium]|nr:phosphotransferase family protein [Candidatus Eremiobacteraeota bacterium]
MNPATPNNALDAVRDGIERFLFAETKRAARVERLRMLAGGASQESWGFDAAFGDGERLALVMRRDMGGVLTLLTLPRDVEFAVLSAAYDAGVIVARPYFRPAQIAGKPAFFVAFVEGETVGRRIVADPAIAAMRSVLVRQLAEALAAIHRLDYRGPALARFVPPNDGSTPFGRELARLYAELDSIEEAHPALELVLRYLTLHAPPPGETVFLHGDFRMGNVIVGASGLRAVLDWEFAHAGDPHEELAWFCVRAWRFGNDALEAGGIASREEWLAAYEIASGRRLDRERIAAYEIMGNVRWAIGALMQARRHLSGQETSIELASLGRVAAEMESEALRMVEAAGAR